MTPTYMNSGPRMSPIVIAGELAFLSGQLPEPDCKPDLIEQSQMVLQKVDDLLTQAGSSRSKIVMASVYLADMDDFAKFNTVWDDWIVKDHAPARVCLESRLARPEWKVEVQVVAAL